MAYNHVTKAELAETLAQVRLDRDRLKHSLQLASQDAPRPESTFDPSDSSQVFWRAFNSVEKSKLQGLKEWFYEPQWGGLIDPLAQLFDGRNLIQPLFSGRWDQRIAGNSFWISESQLDLIRWYARWLFDTNQTAKGVIRSLENYILKTGFAYVCTAKDGKADVSKVQSFVDSFLETNNWFERELDLHCRSRRDGEWFVRLVPQDDGPPEVRIVEPDWVRSPDAADPQYYFGVKVSKDNLEKVEAYWLTDNGVIADGEEVPASYMVHQKRNVDLIVRRGLSDFFCSQDALQAVQKLLKASVLGESVRQAIAYVRQFAQAPAQVVTSLQQANTDFSYPIPSQQGVRLQPTTIVTPGSVVDIPEGLEFMDGPKGAAANATAILEKAYESLAAYWQVPAWIVSGVVDANYASSLTSESPMIRNCEKEQKLYAGKFKEIILKAIDIAIEQGQLPEGCLDEISLQVHVPPLTVRDTMQETQRHQLLAQSGLLSRRTWSDQEELDFDSEQESIRNEGPTVAQAPEATGQAPSPDAHADYQRQVGDNPEAS